MVKRGSVLIVGMIFSVAYSHAPEKSRGELRRQIINNIARFSVKKAGDKLVLKYKDCIAGDYHLMKRWGITQAEVFQAYPLIKAQKKMEQKMALRKRNSWIAAAEKQFLKQLFWNYRIVNAISK